MGIKFAREYEDISKELAEAIYNIENYYSFFEMNPLDFNALTEEERKDCAKTLADDLFYGLGAESVINVGVGKLKHYEDKHVIVVDDGKGGEQIIRLI